MSSGKILLIVASVLVLTCLSRSTERSLHGGYSDADVDDPKIINLAKEALKAHSNKVGHPLKLKKIHSAQKQVVSGMNYKLLIEPHGNLKCISAMIFVPLPHLKKPNTINTGDKNCPSIS